MTTIVICGVGLMGGSLALCFKGKPGLRVVGHSPRQASVERMLELGVVDEATTSLREAAEQADFIFLCVPVGKLEDYVDELRQYRLKPGCIITDVGSTKAQITDYAAKADLGGAYFIGGHPMAGSERSGIDAASSLLYENAFYVLTPTPNVPEDAYERLVRLLEWTRAQIIRLDARQHDEIVAAISHLPHIIAVALVNQIARYNKENGLHEVLAAGGFRDITRIASSEPGIWRDILLSNREMVLKTLEDWKREISDFERLLVQEDGDGIARRFEEARAFREKLPERRKGVITALYDIYVDVPDHPGIIGKIATLLGHHGVNLSNIQVIESRADVPGVLRLSFRNQEDQDRAIDLLKTEYTIHL